MTSCQTADFRLARTFPAENTIPGWKISQPISIFDQDNLYNLVDGQADSFFAYGFRQVAVQRYTDASGVNLHIEVWQLATSADAFGLFTAGRTGQPITIGNGGDTDPGRRLSYWQDRYFVALNADQLVPEDTLLDFAQAIAGALPIGGETPAIVARLPRDGLDEHHTIFFHQETSVQMEVWLGGSNLLGLGQDTSGVIGRYTIGDAAVRLMLVEYPDEKRAADGLAALQSGRIGDVATADVNGTLLGAVFGAAEDSRIRMLLQDALK